MSQSNYEKYAVVKQQELLHKERNLQQAISCLRDRRKFASLQSIDSAIDFVADFIIIREMKALAFNEDEIVECLEYHFGFDMSWHPISVNYKKE